MEAIEFFVLPILKILIACWESIHSGVIPENFMAMIEACNKYGKY